MEATNQPTNQPFLLYIIQHLFNSSSHQTNSKISRGTHPKRNKMEKKVDITHSVSKTQTFWVNYHSNGVYFSHFGTTYTGLMYISSGIFINIDVCWKWVLKEYPCSLVVPKYIRYWVIGLVVQCLLSLLFSLLLLYTLNGVWMFI